MSGVRQGCPLSSSIFVLVTDCMIQFIKSKLPYGCIVRAFADDLAVVTKHLWEDVDTIYNIFKVIGKGCNLRLNAKNAR